MNHKSRFLGSAITTMKQLSLVALAAVFLVAFPVASNAQQTSSDLRGTIYDDSGSPVPGATVVIRNNDSGLTRTTTTNANGEYLVRNLPIGDSYHITVSGQNMSSERAEDVAVNLGKTTEFDFSLTSGETIEEIVVLGSEMVASQVAVGPNATFSLDALQTAPAINRNLTDVLRADARIYVDESRGGINAVQCGGKNSRFNSLTVDGVRMNDSFGLNGNGYPTERMPFSYDAIEQVSVEMAPFDVEYGGFSACNINAVTKSGGNSFSGSAFYDYTSDSMRADSLEGDSITTGAYTEDRYGVTFGGPIIQDKLFFFVAYEKLDGANLFDRGPIGSGAVNEVQVEQQELQAIADIALQNYQYDVGFIPSSLPHEDEKLLAKFDWNISETQRLAFTYIWNDGENFTESDSDQNEFEFSNHLYERGAELTSYSASLYSDWTDRFSTELRVSAFDIDNRQISIGGTDFGEIRVALPDRIASDGVTELDGVDVYLGSDDSRQSNDLNYDVMSIALKGNYYVGDHSLTFGVERKELDIFNLFVQHSSTEVRFAGIQDFQDGFASAMYYNNAPSLDPLDAAADWGYEINTVYLQDDVQANDNLSLIFGLRYDWYTTDSAPPLNQDFLDDYGFGNNATVDGIGLLQPRFGFTWDMSGDTTLHGGIGLYSGGDPNVWLSNTYSANNVQQFGQRGRNFGYTDGTRSLFDGDIVWVPNNANTGLPAGPGYGVPSELSDAVASGVGDNFEINYLDPNFELPSEWKFSLGVSHNFPGDYFVTADLLYSQGVDTAMVLHGDLDQVGTNPDGYPQYDSTREASFVLTNSAEGNRATVLSLSLAKSIGDSFDYTIGYSYTDAEDIQPMTSSVAFSNYTNRAFFDPQEDVRSTSNYQIENRFVATGKWRKEFSARTLLTVSLHGQYNSGRPYSVAFDGTIDPYGFTPYLDFLPIVLEPGVSRNQYTGSSWTKVDMLVNFDFPGFGQDHQASAFLIIDNLTNLLSDDWGVQYQHNFPRTVRAGTVEPRIGDSSRYEIRFGVRYSF